MTGPDTVQMSGSGESMSIKRCIREMAASGKTKPGCDGSRTVSFSNDHVPHLVRGTGIGVKTDAPADATEKSRDVPESERLDLLRKLLRAMQPDVVGAEIDIWLRECGPGGAAIRLSLSSAGLDSLVQTRVPPPAPHLAHRDGFLNALRHRNMVVANVGFDIIVQPLEEKAAEEKREEELSNRAWLHLVRTELGPALRSGTLSRVSRDRRGRVWKLCARVARVASMHGARAAAADYYTQLVAKSDAHQSEANDDISRDLGRSMPDIVEIASPEGQQRLRRCLSAYALHNPELGYCQGMNFMAAVLQLHVPHEDDAFWCLDALVQERIPGGLSRSLTGFKVSVLVLCDLAKTLLPDEYLDLEGLGIPVHDVLSMICPQWFISLFVNALPLQLVFKFWDVIFLEGSVAVFQLSLAIIATFAQHLAASREAFPQMAPDYVAQLITFSRRAPELVQHGILARREALAQLLTHEKIKGVWRTNEARVREEVARDDLQRTRLAAERRLEYQVAQHVSGVMGVLQTRMRALQHIPHKCPQVMAALERAVKAADVYLARLSVYVAKDCKEGRRTCSTVSTASPPHPPPVPSPPTHVTSADSKGAKVLTFLPSFLHLFDARGGGGGAAGAGGTGGEVTWAEEEAELDVCTVDVRRLLDRLLGKRREEELILVKRPPPRDVVESVQSLLAALVTTVSSEVPAARYALQVLTEALPGALSLYVVEPLYHKAEAAVLEDSDAWQRDWGRLVRCLLTVKRLRAENEICGVKLSTTTNRELDDIILHICNKLQGHFGRTCVRNLEEALTRALQDWHLATEDSLFSYQFATPLRPPAIAAQPRPVLLVLVRNLDVLMRLVRLLPRVKHLHLAYAALLQHVRQLAGVAGAVSEIPESEVRRRVDLALQVLTDIKGRLFPPEKKKDAKRSLALALDLSSEELSKVLYQLHWVEVLCLSLPDPWRKLQSDVDTYRARARLLIEKSV